MLMKRNCLLAFLCLALLSLPAQAQPAAPSAGGTKLTKAETQQFYKSCLTQAQADPRMTPQTRNIYCQCTALHTQSAITKEDIKASMGNDQASRNAMNKILVKVYAPCMEYPVRDLLAGKCAKDIGIANICSCLSDKMGGYTAREAQRMLGTVLEQNPNIADPLGAIMETKQFKDNEQRLALSCAELLAK